MSEIIHLDDLPFNLTKEESNYLMEIIPSDISALAYQYGYSDTVFRENLHEYIIAEKLKYASVEEYYKSDVAKNYFDNKQLLSNEILFGEVKKYKIVFDVVFFGKDDAEVSNIGSIGITAVSYDKARKNAFFAVVSDIFKKGYVLKKLEITKIDEE